MLRVEWMIFFLPERSRGLLTTFILTLSDLRGQCHLERSNLQKWPKWCANMSGVLLNMFGVTGGVLYNV